MNKTDKIIAYIMQQLNQIGEDFGWQMGRIGANYENGYMKCNQDSKSHFRKEKIKQNIEEMLREDHIVEANKMIVTNADRIRNMTDEELAELLAESNTLIKCKDCSEPMNKWGSCIGNCENAYLKWLKEKVE